ncbi:MAG: hypothetical protein LUE23_11180 [Lachnospiraceae bacterium]|nr:hypothetical protein [Lachnospiraceae bacterium]
MRHHISSPGWIFPVLASGILLGGLFGSGPGRVWADAFGVFSSAYPAWLVRGVWEPEPHFLQLAALRGGSFPSPASGGAGTQPLPDGSAFLVQLFQCGFLVGLPVDLWSAGNCFLSVLPFSSLVVLWFSTGSDDIADGDGLVSMAAVSSGVFFSSGSGDGR